jgi:predicted TIM-barrel fold metal-dependent hydrolase
MLVIGNDLVIDYPILDADAHVNEPPDTWKGRVPAKFAARAPRVVRLEDGGDAWQFDENKPMRRMGLTAVAGLSYVGYRNSGMSYEMMRPGNYEPKARLADLDLDGIATQLLYPSVALGGAHQYSDDAELQSIICRGYNDWLAEFCAAGEGRLFGLGVIPIVGLESALAELRHCREIGHRGVILSRFPSGGFELVPEDDRFFALAEELEMPLHVHLGSFTPTVGTGHLTGLAYLALGCANKSGADVIPVATKFMLSGIFDRFPGLRVVLVEGNIGWIPTVLEQSDDMFLRYRFWTGAHQLKRLPSEYFYENMRSTFMIDTAGVALRHRCGLRNIMWSTDYPHSGTDWPNSRVTLERNFTGVPYAEVKRMIHENTAELYRINVPSPPGRGLG